MVWEYPQEQFGDFDSPDLQAKCRLCVDSGVCGNGWFISDHEQRGRSKPGCRVVEVFHCCNAELVSEADCRSSYVLIHVYGHKSQQTGCGEGLCLVVGDSFDPSVSRYGRYKAAAGGSRQRDVQWGRSLCDGNELSHGACCTLSTLCCHNYFGYSGQKFMQRIFDLFLSILDKGWQ